MPGCGCGLGTRCRQPGDKRAILPGETVCIGSVAAADVNEAAARTEGEGSGKKIKQESGGFRDRGRSVLLPEAVMKAVSPKSEVEGGEAIVVLADLDGKGRGRLLKHVRGPATRRTIRGQGRSW